MTNVGRAIECVEGNDNALPIPRPALQSRHLHRLVCECLSATKGERGRGRIDSREIFLEANKKCGTHSDLGSAACRLPAEAFFFQSRAQ